MGKTDFHRLLIGVDSKVKTLNHGNVRGINFDNAATTPPFRKVMEVIMELTQNYGSIGRGVGQKSEKTTKLYNEARDYLLDYFHIIEKDKYTIIYVNNTTDGINKLSRTLIKDKSDIVIATRMEHHSNDLPWRRVCNVDYVEVDENGRLLINKLEEMLINYNGKVKYVTVSGASNVTGYVNDIHKIARVAHKYNCKIIVDGAQLVPHKNIDMSGNSTEEAIDYLVFSAHKLYAPFGSGAIVGLREEFEENLPPCEGGGAVSCVYDKAVEYLLPPEKDEAGTPNYFGVMAMVMALKELKRLELIKIEAHEFYLKEKLMKGLMSIPNVTIYGDNNFYSDTLGIVVFNVDKLNHQKVAEILSKEYGIAVRQGWFCAHPYCRRLMHVSEKDEMLGMIRVSFGMYNSSSEVDYFLDVIEKIEKKNR